MTVVYGLSGRQIKASDSVAPIVLTWSSTVTVPFNSLRGYYSLVMIANTAFNFPIARAGNLSIVQISGNYLITWPSSVIEIFGDYDGTTTNWATIECIDETVGAPRYIVNWNRFASEGGSGTTGFSLRSELLAAVEQPPGTLINVQTGAPGLFQRGDDTITLGADSNAFEEAFGKTLFFMLEGTELDREDTKWVSATTFTIVDTIWSQSSLVVTEA